MQPFLVMQCVECKTVWQRWELASSTNGCTGRRVKNQLFALLHGWTFCEASFSETCLEDVHIKYQSLHQ